MLHDEFEDGLPPRPIPAPWTASRCSRTLRKLSTFVIKLEKCHQASLAASGMKLVEENRQGESDPLPSWLAQDTVKRGKSRKMYTARRRTTPQTPAPKPSGMSRSAGLTPRNNALPRVPDINFIARVSNAWRDTPSMAMETGTPTLFPPMSQRWTAGTAHLHEDYESIVRDGWIAIPSFLVATSDPDCPSNIDTGPESNLAERGARSLMDMCLASLSRQMVEEQQQNDAHENRYAGQHDIVDAQLQELEDYFGDLRTGWSPLRKVVRECGISMITRLIKNGALTEKTATALTLHCRLRPFLLDFVGAVLEALVEAPPHVVDSGNKFHNLPSMDMVLSQGGQPYDMWTSQLSCQWVLRALQTSEDPMAWVASGIRFNHLSLFVLFSKKSQACQHSVVDLLEAVYHAALACNQTHSYEDLRKGLTSVRVERGETQPVGERAHLNEPPWIRLKMTFYFMLSHSNDSDSGTVPARIANISRTAEILVGLGQELHFSALQQLLTAQIFLAEICYLSIKDCTIPHGLLRSFDSLLCSMESRHTLSGQLAGTITIPFAQDLEGVQCLVEKILAIRCIEFERLHILLLQIASDGAMDYLANNPSNPALLPWALKIHEKTREQLGSLIGRRQGPSDQDLGIGYRWDSDIEEWIAKTPRTMRYADSMCSKTTAHLSRPEIGVFTSKTARGRETLARQTANVPTRMAGPRQKSGKVLKRKGLSDDFKVYSDGDFEYSYKKPRRETLSGPRSPPGSAGIANTFKSGRQDRKSQKFEDISGDELSLTM